MRTVTAVTLAALLEETLRCPECDSAVTVEGDDASCSSGHRFDVVDGVVVLVDESLLQSDPQYSSQRDYFDAEFGSYQGYQLENWRRSYLDRLRTGGLLGSGPLVDVGVGGSGYTVIEAGRAGSPAVGCDLSLAALTTARRFAGSEGVGGQTLWVCCSAERLPFATASFVSAVAIAVFEHVPDDASAFRELARVLRPGGRAWVTVPHALRHISPLFRGANRRHDRRLGHLRRYEAEQLSAMGDAVGLRTLDVQFTGHPIKVLQLLTGKFWWRFEHRDLHRAHVRRGAMQLSALFERAA
jgi:ubiquinone/menaquinone biosynthesis C-methylase UbiE